MNRRDIHAELRRARADFHDLVARAGAKALERPRQDQRDQPGKLQRGLRQALALRDAKRLLVT